MYPKIILGLKIHTKQTDFSNFVNLFYKIFVENDCKCVENY
jgi:succinyl-CoA synthetase beta subunit